MADPLNQMAKFMLVGDEADMDVESLSHERISHLREGLKDTLRAERQAVLSELEKRHATLLDYCMGEHESLSQLLLKGTSLSPSQPRSDSRQNVKNAQANSEQCQEDPESDGPGKITRKDLGADGPGKYEICQEFAYVDSEKTFDSSQVAELSKGDVVNIVEIVVMPGIKRVRARIAEPAGWMSLINMDTGYRWAQKYTLDSLSQPAKSSASNEVPNESTAQGVSKNLGNGEQNLQLDYQISANGGASDVGFASGGTSDSLRPSPSPEKNFKKSKSQEMFHGAEAEAKNCMHGVVLSRGFEISFAVLISVNTVILALEAQWAGFTIGRDLGYPRYDQSSDDTWPGMSTVFEVLDWTFGVLFIGEIVAKVVGLRREFIHDWWNWFDTLVVLGWLVDALTRGMLDLPIDPMLLRLARLARLLRLIKLIRTLKGVDTLFLMITSLKGSFTILGWALVLLFIAQTMFALFLNQILVQYYLTQGNEVCPSPDELACQRSKQMVFEYFGTFTRSIMSLFEMTFANYTVIARLVSEEVSEWFIVVSLAHKFTLGFSVMGVINGIFIKETFKVAECDDAIMLMQKQRATEMHAYKMQKLFAAADDSGDGIVDQEEFVEIVQDPDVNAWLAAQELDVGDPYRLFILLDSERKGKLAVEDVVAGVSRLKGSARSVDMLELVQDHAALQTKVNKICEKLGVDRSSIRSRRTSMVDVQDVQFPEGTGDYQSESETRSVAL